MSGFTFRPPAAPRPAPALAARGEQRCNEAAPDSRQLLCERPAGHAGAHLCASASRYWQRSAS